MRSLGSFVLLSLFTCIPHYYAVIQCNSLISKKSNSSNQIVCMRTSVIRFDGLLMLDSIIKSRTDRCFFLEFFTRISCYCNGHSMSNLISLSSLEVLPFSPKWEDADSQQQARHAIAIMTNSIFDSSEVIVKEWRRSVFGASPLYPPRVWSFILNCRAAVKWHTD